MQCGSTESAAAAFLVRLTDVMHSSEKKGDAPQTGKCDHGIDDSAQNSILTAKDPCYQIKAENAHQAPIDATNDGKK